MGQRGVAFIRRPKITFFCLAYNCEKYVGATIRSVLNQTERNIQLVICNNGSTDKTGEICKKYAQKDKRVIYFSNKVNMVTDEGIPYGKRAFWPKFTGEYVSSIDSDDLIAPNFAEKMYKTAKENQVDIAVCGTTMFRDADGKAVGQRLPPSLIVKQMENIEPYFSELYGQFRPVWAKIFRTDFFEQYYQYAWEKPDWLHSGGDTFVSLGYLEKCKCLVSIKESLHFYRIREKSTFHTQFVDSLRVQTGQLLYERGLKCIQELGIATPRNQSMLISIFLGHMEDLLRLLESSIEMSVQDKLNFICVIINNPLMQVLCEEKPVFWCLFQQLCQSTDVFIGEQGNMSFKWISNFWLRLYWAWQNRNMQDNSLEWGLLFSALCDPTNCAQFGVYLLKENWTMQSSQVKIFVQLPMEQQKSILKKPATLLSFLSSTKEIYELNENKKKLLSALDCEEYKTVLLLLNDILKTNPLDREAIYFGIYTLFQIGDLQQALLYIQIALVLWPQDEDIQQLCLSVLQRIGEDYLDMSEKGFDLP